MRIKEKYIDFLHNLLDNNDYDPSYNSVFNYDPINNIVFIGGNKELCHKLWSFTITRFYSDGDNKYFICA